ncbi:hypothetical protein EB796_009513 [Bugula neritina]|uniref:Tryptophan synthase beta chain-like PALP domain-containing protein n=1 Tax=Bugula neritina TaxID=10212 RepID=A0A7J7K1W2_BUGNE|nr:hypothetical protein EB796_009513 [Bugula neritina]
MLRLRLTALLPVNTSHDQCQCYDKLQQIRKLEFIIADAIQKGCKHIITCGTSESNHCRATAAACAELGLKSHLFLESYLDDVSKVKYDGNLFINRLCGANIYLVPRPRGYKDYIKPRMQMLADKIERETGEKSKLVSTGGSDEIGLWGFIQCFDEIRRQGIEFDDVVVTCATGGTVAGLTIANYLAGQPYKCHGILVCADSKFMHNEINENMQSLGITGVRSEDLVTMYEDYKGPAYCENYPYQLEYIVRTAHETGILLDNAYTGKAAYGFSQLLQNKPEVFKGRRILFLYSGGLISLQTQAMAEALLPLESKSTIMMFPEKL